MLVGGAGTAWTSSHAGYGYMVVDTEAVKGYLTAG